MKQDQATRGGPTEEEIRAVKRLLFIDVRPDQPSVLDENWKVEMICKGHVCYFPGCGDLHPSWGHEPFDSIVCRELTFPFYAAMFASIYRVDVLERITPFLVAPAVGRVLRRTPAGDVEVRNYRTLVLNRFGPRLSTRGGREARYWRCPTCRRVRCEYAGQGVGKYYLRDQLEGGLVQTCLNTCALIVADAVLDKLRLDELPDAHLLQYMKYPLRDEPIDGRRMKMFLPLDEVNARLKKRGWKKPTRKEVKTRLAEMKALGFLMSAVQSEPKKSTPAQAATPAKKTRSPRK